MVNIDHLTNEEIRDQLMIHGCDPGPVVGSTRNVYANKLRRLLEEESEANAVVPPEVRSYIDIELPVFLYYIGQLCLEVQSLKLSIEHIRLKLLDFFISCDCMLVMTYCSLCEYNYFAEV